MGEVRARTPGQPPDVQEGSCNHVNRIDLLRQRLADADSLPAVLATGWDAMELIAAVASASAGESPDMYPVFTLARGAAVTGRNVIAFAPSLPPPADAAHDVPEPAGGTDQIADALANLASALSMRLRQSAGRAADPADRCACEDAADEADRITRLLAKDVS
jgi:hypothetical protein